VLVKIFKSVTLIIVALQSGTSKIKMKIYFKFAVSSFAKYLCYYFP